VSVAWAECEKVAELDDFEAADGHNALRGQHARRMTQKIVLRRVGR
jgi:hypothetical protein